MPLADDRATEILLEEVLASRGKARTPDRDSPEVDYRQVIRRQVEVLKKAGAIIEIPSD